MLELAFGCNPFQEANYRVVWSEDRLDWIGGKINDFDANGTFVRALYELRREPKYQTATKNRWIVEKWYPAEFYGSSAQWFQKTRDWEENGLISGGIPQLGPYPYRGDYEHCCTLEERGEFLQLTPDVIDYTIALIRNKLSQKWLLSERRKALLAAEEKQQADDEEMLQESNPAFGGNESGFVT